MSKTITVSDEVYEKIKEQVEQDSGGIKKKSEKKLEIKNRFTGAVIYTSSKTTYKDALEKAITSGSDLRSSDLRGSDLSGSNLRSSNLSGSNLSGSNLSGSDLSGSNLSSSDLRSSNLSGSNLRGSNLSGSNLSGVDFYRALFYGKGGTTKIGKEQVNDFLTALGVIVID